MKLNEARYREMTSSPTGTVGRFLSRRAEQIEFTAKAIATEERLVRSGEYRASIFGRLVSMAGGLAVSVGAISRPGREIEFGTHEHFIRPRNARALWWDMPNDRGWMVQPDDGRPVSVVLHPGNRPYMVLHRAVARVLKGGIA